MIIPSFDSLFTSREKLVKTVQSLCAAVNSGNTGNGGAGDTGDYVTMEQIEQLLGQGLPDALMEGYIPNFANQPFPEDWKNPETVDDTEDLVRVINNDSSALPGRCYVDCININNRKGLSEDPIKVEIFPYNTLDPNHAYHGKQIVLTVRTSDSPYYWYYVSVFGEPGTWRAFEPYEEPIVAMQ